MIIGFIVPGNPLPWARAKRSQGRRGKPAVTYNDPKQTSYKRSIAWCAVKARNEALLEHGFEWPLDAVFSVTVVVHRKDWKCMDSDRLLNNVADACQGVLWENDRHKFLRDARVVIGNPSIEPHIAIMAQVRDTNEHRDVVDGLESAIMRLIDRRGQL